MTPAMTPARERTHQKDPPHQAKGPLTMRGTGRQVYPGMSTERVAAA